MLVLSYKETIHKYNARNNTPDHKCVARIMPCKNIHILLWNYIVILKYKFYYFLIHISMEKDGLIIVPCAWPNNHIFSNYSKEEES